MSVERRDDPTSTYSLLSCNYFLSQKTRISKDCEKTLCWLRFGKVRIHVSFHDLPHYIGAKLRISSRYLYAGELMRVANLKRNASTSMSGSVWESEFEVVFLLRGSCQAVK
jgi:hypothetical protein